MPVLNGFTATVQILNYLSKQELQAYNIKLPYLCLLTNADLSTVRKKILDNGFDSVIQKPLSMQDL